MGITEDQRNQYEQAAKKYSNKFWEDFSDNDVVEQSAFHTKNDTMKAFIKGCSHAHSKIEEAEREAHNRAIDEAIAINETTRSWHQMKEELKKLRK